MADMTFSEAGMALVQQFEGLELTAYRDVAGIWTIGYGHTGKDVHPGLTITQAEAKGLLVADLHSAISVVNRLVKVPLTQNRFDAVVDFTFNAGIGALSRSTLLKKVNAGDFAGAEAEFPHWVYAAGVQVPALARRRAAEAELFRKAG